MEPRCPDCSSPTEGAEVCPCCGAFDFEGGLTSWVCYPCGGQNAHGEQRCCCGRARAIECGACGADVPFAAASCPQCEVPRYAFDAARQARRRSEEIQRLRECARSLSVILAPLAILGALMLTGGGPPAQLVGGGLAVLAIVGELYALSTDRQARRQLQ